MNFFPTYSRAARLELRGPRVKAAIVLSVETDATLNLLFGGKRIELKVRVGDVTTLVRTLSRLTGIWTVSEIAHASNIPIGDVETLVSELEGAGLLTHEGESTDSDSVVLDDVLQAANSFFQALRFDFRRHPLFARMKHDESLFVGAAYEYWFLIGDASTHISLAIEHADSSLRPLLRDYLEIEKDHSDVIAPHLASALRIPTTLLAQCRPCAAADAAILKTRHLAQTDTLAYIASASFCEAPIRRSFGLDCKSNAWSNQGRSLLQALSQHQQLDQSCEHASLLARALMSLDGRISRTDITRALEATHQSKHYLDNLNHEILQTYGVDGAALPRLTATYTDFIG